MDRQQIALTAGLVVAGLLLLFAWPSIEGAFIDFRRRLRARKGERQQYFED